MNSTPAPLPEPAGEAPGALAALGDVAFSDVPWDAAQARVLADNAFEIVVILDIEGRIVFQNQAAVRVLGWTWEEVKGQNALDWMHPEDRPEAARALSRALSEEGRAEGVAQILVGRVRHRNRPWQLLEMRGRVLTEGNSGCKIVVHAREVSAERAHEELLRHSHLFWQSTLDSLDIGLSILDLQGRIVACNQAWRAQSWCQHDCEIGHRFSFDTDLRISDACGSSTDESTLRSCIQAVLSGSLRQFHGEFECLSTQGERRCYSVRGSQLNVSDSPDSQRGAASALRAWAGASASTWGESKATGALMGYVLIACEEITERCLAQDEREALARRQAAEQAAREQEQKSRERSDFLARAGEVLASSLDLETTLRQTARLCVPFLADWCLVDLVEGDAFRRVDICFAEVENGAPLPPGELERRREVVSNYRRLFSLHSEVKFGVAHIISSGRSQVFPDVTTETLQNAASDDEHLRMLQALRMHSAMCIPLSTRGRTLGALSFVRSHPSTPGAPLPASYNADDLKMVEDMARVAALAVDNARLFGQAEAANRAKDDFLAVLSHELRTPLTPILGWVYLLREDKHDEEIYKRALDIIEANARIQSRLIEDLIDVSRVVTGKLSLEKRSVSLAQLARDVVDSARPQITVHELELSVQAPDVGLVLGDEGRLRQAMSNLLSNAIKFTPPGGHIQVLVQKSDSEGTARFVVTDDGRGIEPQFLPRVFDRFEQADSSSARGEGGLGLGLTIVRHIMREHGGDVRAHSLGPGQGSTFSLELPLLPSMSEERARELESPPILAIEGAKILVADDEADARDLLETLLTRAGATVRTTSESAEAWQMFLDWRPDIVVLDLSMPGEDGFSLMRRLRALPSGEGGRVAALAVSAHARPEDRQRAAEAGFHAYVVKPIDPGKLALALLELLALSRR